MMQAIDEFGGSAQAMNLGTELPARVSLNEFRAFVVSQRGWVFDARPEVFYEMGHVPSALSLPREDFEKAYTSLRAKLETDKQRPIAVYCSDEDCEDSEMVGEALRNLGYERATVLKAGRSQWDLAGLPEVKPQ